MNRSSTSSTTSAGRAPGRSILLSTTTGFLPKARAFFSTKRVWGMQPSKASTSRSTPSTIISTRSTSPPKSAWPGVSTMLILVPLYMTAVFFDRMVMPRSRSRSPESMTRSATASFWRNTPDCRSSWSTRVVLPWSTWAMMATLRRSSRSPISHSFLSLQGASFRLPGGPCLGPGLSANGNFGRAPEHAPGIFCFQLLEPIYYTTDAAV